MKDRGKARIPLENIQSKSGGALLALLKLRSTVLIEYKDVIGVKEVLFFFVSFKKQYLLVICSSVRLWIKYSFHRLIFIFVDYVSITNSMG